MSEIRRWVVLGVSIAAAAAMTMAILVGPGDPINLRGIVVDDAGRPVAGATVRIQATAAVALTDDRGRFTLEVPEPGMAVAVTAWADGFYIEGGDIHRPGGEVEMTLRPLDPFDHAEYEWLSVAAQGTGEDQGCAACHAGAGTGLDHLLPVDEWLLDAHSGAATNPRFLTMYAGTDVSGRQSPPTQHARSRDYGTIPLRPDPALPYFGPGYRIDFPDSQGNCASCHAPMASIDDPYGVDPTLVDGIAREGIGCDFCHKVWDVAIDDSTGLPDPNRPGVLSFEFRRPPEGHQFFAGPLDDVAPGEDTYTPLQTESRYCAPCHFGVFWDTVVYNSFGEWLESPYADPLTGQTCQDCHMPRTGATTFALRDAGGLERDPGTIASHLMPGAADPALLRNALTMSVAADVIDNGVEVTVDLVNDLTGHHIPTDSPLRHMILLVEAAGPEGPLDLLEGQRLPDWTGVGDPRDGYYAGLPGTAYAKVLEELWTEVSPTGAYWNQTRVVSDNRIPALGTDTSRYRFAAPPAGAVQVRVTLWFRRAFIDLADQKAWDDPDIEMESAVIDLVMP